MDVSVAGKERGSLVGGEARERGWGPGEGILLLSGLLGEGEVLLRCPFGQKWGGWRECGWKVGGSAVIQPGADGSLSCFVVVDIEALGNI